MVSLDNEGVEENGLIEKGLLKRPTRKGKIKKEFALEEASDFIIAEGELLLRIPTMIHGIRYVLEEIESSTELVKYFYPKTRRDNPVRACLMVGGLSRTSIGHIDSYDHIVGDIEKITEDDYHKRIREIARRNADFDGFLITRNMTTSPNVPAKKLLNLFPVVEIEDFEGYEFHGDCTKTEREFLQSKEFYDSDSDYAIGEHELEILSRDEYKEKKPVILWDSEKLDPRIGNFFDGYVEKGLLRTIDAYLRETWNLYEQGFKERFPESYELIIAKAASELEELRNRNWREYLKELNTISNHV